ncbi:MAG: plastocyanin/azurin family copper-binding protein [Thermodesulfobacteriota bacterium]
MNKRATILTLAILAVFMLTGRTHAEESKFLKDFLGAYDRGMGVEAVVERHKDKVPAEIKGLIRDSKREGITPGVKAEKLFIAEAMARGYKNVTGDISYLVEVKRLSFNAMLHGPVRPDEAGRVHVVDMPVATEKEKNVFKPDNLVIKAGDTVRWTNHARARHIFASMPLIGKKVPFTPSVKPDETWEYTFKEPGEYFYFCFIHKSMVGKIVVEGAEEEPKKQ